MSENTKTGVITYMENDQVVDFYPTTKASSVVGLEELVKSLAGGSGSSDDLGYTISTDPSTGAVTKTYTNGDSVVTQKNADGSITETTYVNGSVYKTETIMKNDDGSIDVTIVTASGEFTSYTIRKDSATDDMITEYSDGTKIVVHKNTDGSVIETTYKNDSVVKSVTTTKNADGSISVTPTSG